VAIMLPNVEEFPITWLALARLGAVAVPINVNYTGREVEYVLSNSKTKHLVIYHDFEQLLDGLPSAPEDTQIVLVGGGSSSKRIGWSDLMSRAGNLSAPLKPVKKGHILNLQYTSGTTGFPKACMLTHEYWLILGLTMANIYGTRIGKYHLSSSFYYMLGPRILLNAMFSGGSIVAPKKPSAKNFWYEVKTYECEYCIIFEPFLKQPEREDDGENNLKIAYLPGLSKHAIIECIRRFNVLGQDAYGMTEIGLGTYVPPCEIEETAGTGTCGYVAPFREAIICDENGAELPGGEIGELCVRGPGLLLGYYGNEEATAKSFRNGWFRTGDLARVDRYGRYYILGRSKDMVRRSGENIAAREVESVLRLLTEIEEAAVVPVPDEKYGEEIKAYIKLSSSCVKNEKTLKRIISHCYDNLARFKVPRYYEFRDEFAMTESQRVQKKLLLNEKSDLRIGSYDRIDKLWR
jgi:crotonobetaine/carnitine-CoA ligase